jgi:chromate transport protein ChrA
MISNQLWVWAVDHRISAAIVLFVLMLVLNTGKRRSRFFLRAGVSVVVMCLCSWLLRTLSDEWIRNVYLQAMCYSVQIMVLHLLFVGCSFFCYRANQAEAWYNGLLGLTILKIVWNVFKTGSSLMMINGLDAPWGQ